MELARASGPASGALCLSSASIYAGVSAHRFDAGFRAYVTWVSCIFLTIGFSIASFILIKSAYYYDAGAKNSKRRPRTKKISSGNT